MSNRELRALGNPFNGQPPVNLEFTTRSGRTRDPTVVAQQQARVAMRARRARVQRAIRSSRVILKSRVAR